MAVRLNPAQRADAVRRLAAEEFDIVVVGGGVTGTGAALDAATRGLRVALVEARDWAAGTSSRSSKLIHGGLRYLEQLNFGLVKEALTERGLLLEELAPHLVRPVPFMYPLSRRYVERPYVGVGLVLYDTMGGARRGIPRHRHWSKRKALRVNPGFNPRALIGAVRYYDAQVDDARYTMMLARTAVHHGAVAATQVKVTGLLREADHIAGVRARDLLTGGELTVRGQRVVNATGPWTDQVQGLAGASPVRVRPSKGIHFVVPRDRITLGTGLILRTEKSVLFVIPWHAYWIIGTTDTAWEFDVDEPPAHRGDIDYLLERVNAVLSRPLTHDDILGVFSGVRPLLAPAGDAGGTAALSREHTVMETAPGLFSIAGGKLTTYRVMAKDIVDEAAKGLGRAVPASCTARVPLLGGAGYEARLNERERLAADAGLHVAWIDHLLGRYGDLVGELLDLVADEPELGRPLEGADGYLRAEAAYAASHEGALTVEDVLARRTRAVFETPDRGVAAAREVAALVAEPLGWDEARCREEVDRFRLAVEAALKAEHETTDEAAVAAQRALLDASPGAGAAAAG
jgi:glycerol-3-phosphate dehydrogenase